MRVCANKYIRKYNLFLFRLAITDNIQYFRGTKRPAITKHLNNIYKTGELSMDSTCSILEHMGNDSTQRYSTKYYNLDAIFRTGHRRQPVRMCYI